MKKLALLTFFVLLFLNKIVIAQNTGISDESHTPDASAVLDAYSTTKGILIPRVALTASNTAGPITSPATGLLIYNTATTSLGTVNDVKPGYYYNSGDASAPVWARALNTDLTNGISIQDDGSLLLNGTATCWNDMTIPAFTSRNSGSGVPTWDLFIGNIYSLMFDNSVREVHFSVQLPHNYKIGTDIYPHVHWAPTTAATTTRVEWVLEYTWVNLGEQYSATTTTSGYEITYGASRSLGIKESAITPLTAISGVTPSSRGISSILLCRLYRNGTSVNDTFTGTAALNSFDFHFQIDSFGSRQEFIK